MSNRTDEKGSISPLIICTNYMLAGKRLLLNNLHLLVGSRKDCCPTPSSGWRYGGSPSSPSSCATFQDLSYESYIAKEILMKDNIAPEANRTVIKLESYLSNFKLIWHWFVVACSRGSKLQFIVAVFLRIFYVINIIKNVW